MRPRNLTKPFTIAGFVLGEIYMLFAALAPYHDGTQIPLMGKVMRILGTAIFFGPFGAAAGMGIGLLVGAIWQKKE
ncbi:MAG: hypothetical protein JWL90_1807 [Chthoniobacteraceae bacterium]|nr:hypothetical protein [Chthoniobacteraceae bacterium]MDB6175309.1 hypothetical protein [Chthoniobacteraceae bacterium]